MIDLHMRRATKAFFHEMNMNSCDLNRGSAAVDARRHLCAFEGRYL